MNSWEFNKHEKTTVPEIEKVTMAARTGLENKYASRFQKYVGTSDDTLKHTDDARKVVDDFRTSIGVIDTQTDNINDLFAVAEVFVKTIDDFQRQSGHRQVRNIPLPGESIKQSPGKKLGYIKLSMQFMNAGLLHFMEETLALQQEIKERDNLIRAIAAETRDIPIIGRLQDISLDDLNSADPIIDTATSYDVGNDSPRSTPDLGSKRDSGISLPETLKREESIQAKKTEGGKKDIKKYKK